MGRTSLCKSSSDRGKWQRIFQGLVHMLQNQQTELITLSKERKLLEDRIQMQCDRWVSDVRLLEDHISQMKGESVIQEMSRFLDAAKSDMVLGLKQREAFINNWKLEHSEDDVADLKAMFDYISYKCSDPKGCCIASATEKRKGGRNSDIKYLKNSKDEERHSILEGEITRLKCEYDKIATAKVSEVSALLGEKEFVWNQYKIMENDYTNKLEGKQAEVEQANEKIAKLISSMEQLQSSNNAKEDSIATLTSNLAKMEADTNKMNGEISRLNRELEWLRKSRSAPVTPVVNRCTARGGSSSLGGKNNGRNSANISVKKEQSAAQVPDVFKDSEKKGGRSLKRKGAVSEIQLLFSSSFKVPKLKNPSPGLS